MGKTLSSQAAYHVTVEIIKPGGDRVAAGVIAAGSRAEVDAAFEAAVTDAQTLFDIDG